MARLGQPRLNDFLNGSLVRAETPPFWTQDPQSRQEVINVFRRQFRTGLPELASVICPCHSRAILRSWAGGDRFVIGHTFNGRVPVANPPLRRAGTDSHRLRPSRGRQRHGHGLACPSVELLSARPLVASAHPAGGQAVQLPQPFPPVNNRYATPAQSEDTPRSPLSSDCRPPDPAQNTRGRAAPHSGFRVKEHVGQSLWRAIVMADPLASPARLRVGDREYVIFRLDAVARQYPPPAAAAVLAQDPAGKPAAHRGRPGRPRRGHRGPGQLGPQGRAGRRRSPSRPARVLLQDFTGVPGRRRPGRHARRHAAHGRRPEEDQPAAAGRAGHRPLGAGRRFRQRRWPSSTNADLEFERNRERYAFLRWGQKAFRNFRVVPPDTGIVHQVNLEYLARVVFTDESDSRSRWPIPTRWSAPIRTRR